MNIYVKSRGTSKDYSWLDESQKEISNPSNIESVIQLVDSDSFSVILYRLEGQIYLLVTGLESRNRTDNQTRTIRNSVLWVGESSQEAALRDITIQALQGNLAAKVDEAVQSENNPQGFIVVFKKLKFDQFESQSLGQETPSQDNQIGNLSELKDELVEELKKCLLPDKEKYIILVSATITQASLEQNQVWRGLSDTIPRDEDWIEISAKSTKENSTKKKSYGGKTSDGKTSSVLSKIKEVLLPFMFVALLISVGVNTWLMTELNKIPERQKEIERLDQEIESKENQEQKLNDEIKELNIQKKNLEEELSKDRKEIETYQRLESDLEKLYQNLQREFQKLVNKYPQLD